MHACMQEVPYRTGLSATPIAMVAALFVLLCLACPTRGWSYESESSFGPSHWSTYFPSCAVTGAQQQGPIRLVAGDLLSSTGSPRLTEYVFTVSPLYLTETVEFSTQLNAGGLLVSRPVAGTAPFYIARRGSFGDWLNVTKYLVEIAFHIDREHLGASALVAGVVAALEIQFQFADTSDLNSPITMSFAQLVMASDSLAALNTVSIARLIASSIASTPSGFLANGAPLITSITSDVHDAFLPVNESAGALMYSGTTTYPPCWPTQTIVLLGIAVLSSAQVAAITSQIVAGTTTATTRGVQLRLVTTTLTKVRVDFGSPLDPITHKLAFPPPVIVPVPTTVVRIVANPVNQRLMMAIIALVALNSGLLLCLFALLSARMEWIDIPMWLGGLGRRVEWWSNPPSAPPLDDDADGDDSDDSSNEEEEEGDNEEEIEGDEGQGGGGGDATAV